MHHLTILKHSYVKMTSIDPIPAIPNLATAGIWAWHMFFAAEAADALAKSVLADGNDEHPLEVDTRCTNKFISIYWYPRWYPSKYTNKSTISNEFPVNISCLCQFTGGYYTWR